jgi:TonB-dependent receptor
MKFKTIITLALIIIVKLAISQNSSIKGKVIDEKTGETLPGAAVLIKGTTTGAQSDLDGNFSINNVAPGKYTIECRLVSYKTKIVEGVTVKSGEPTILTISIGSADNQLGVIEVTTTVSKETNSGLLLMQKNSATVQDGVSSESIKRTPDRSTSDVLKRVSGASIQDNKFAIIRGLNDRYNAAYINGAPLPSSESDRKAFAFDIFPSNMLDNLVIIKTATPDQPAEFAGGIISINTKNIPEKNFQSIALGGGYNTITTFKNQVTYKGGKTDWLGMDDGTRSMPSEIPVRTDFPSKMDDQGELAKKTKTDWALENKKFAPNFNLQYSMGLTDSLLKRPFGIIMALTYNKSNNFNETVRRGYTANGSSGSGTIASQLDYDYLDKVYSEQILTGVLANLSYKLNNNNSITFKNIYSINTDDRVIARSGETNPLESNPTLIKSNARWFTSNKVYSGQLNGDHLLPKSKIKINWVGAMSSIKRDIPNLRRSVYTRFRDINDPSDPNPKDTMYAANIAYANVGPSYGGGMFFSENRENIYSFKADAAYNFDIGKSLTNEIKIGGFYQTRNRTFFARQLGYTRYAKVGGGVSFSDSLLYLGEDQIFAQQNMGLIAPGVGGFKIMDGTKYSDSYKASSDLQAAYLMLDNRYKSLFRLIWGVRIENFTQKLQATKADKSNLDLVVSNLDVLPSANLVYSLNKKQNIRLSYSQTLNRPEYRELAPFAFYDFNTQFVISGNDSLKRAKIHNYDLRYELFQGRGQLVSVSGFYKEFINPIEQTSRPDVVSEISFRNVDKATNYGLELEFRQLLGALFKADSSKFLNNLTVFSNLAIIRSKVNVTGVIGSESSNRPLQGQSPYVWNAGIQYVDLDLGMSFSASFNRVAPRIAIVGNVNEPSIWENSRSFLDLQVTKSFLGNRLEIKLNAQNILAQNQIFYQNRNLDDSKASGSKAFFNELILGDAQNKNGLNKNEDDIIWNTKFGRTFSLSLSYKF